MRVSAHRINAENFNDGRHLALCCFEMAQNLVHGKQRSQFCEQKHSSLCNIV